jgi:hypothetical protein
MPKGVAGTSRASRNARQAANSVRARLKRQYPLRRIVSLGGEFDKLECGHEERRTPSSSTVRRRCHWCHLEQLRKQEAQS